MKSNSIILLCNVVAANPIFSSTTEVSSPTRFIFKTIIDTTVHSSIPPRYIPSKTKKRDYHPNLAKTSDQEAHAANLLKDDLQKQKNFEGTHPPAYYELLITTNGREVKFPVLTDDGKAFCESIGSMTRLEVANGGAVKTVSISSPLSSIDASPAQSRDDPEMTGIMNMDGTNSVLIMKTSTRASEVAKTSDDTFKSTTQNNRVDLPPATISRISLTPELLKTELPKTTSHFLSGLSVLGANTESDMTSSDLQNYVMSIAFANEPLPEEVKSIPGVVRTEDMLSNSTPSGNLVMEESAPPNVNSESFELPDRGTEWAWADETITHEMGRSGNEKLRPRTIIRGNDQVHTLPPAPFIWTKDDGYFSRLRDQVDQRNSWIEASANHGDHVQSGSSPRPLHDDIYVGEDTSRLKINDIGSLGTESTEFEETEAPASTRPSFGIITHPRSSLTAYSTPETGSDTEISDLVPELDSCTTEPDWASTPARDRTHILSSSSHSIKTPYTELSPTEISSVLEEVPTKPTNLAEPVPTNRISKLHKPTKTSSILETFATQSADGDEAEPIDSGKASQAPSETNRGVVVRDRMMLPYLGTMGALLWISGLYQFMRHARGWYISVNEVDRALTHYAARKCA